MWRTERPDHVHVDMGFRRERPSFPERWPQFLASKVHQRSESDALQVLGSLLTGEHSPKTVDGTSRMVWREKKGLFYRIVFMATKCDFHVLVLNSWRNPRKGHGQVFIHQNDVGGHFMTSESTVVYYNQLLKAAFDMQRQRHNLHGKRGLLVADAFTGNFANKQGALFCVITVLLHFMLPN